jgi:SAM-dependent methyltransferase
MKPTHRTTSVGSRSQVAGRGGDDRGQIKTRDRVRELAEVYTHEREIKAMLDLIPDMFPSTAAAADIKFLEPACGSGNFLVEILHRKLSAIRFGQVGPASNYEHRVLRALASIYGVDISPENVAESRDRMLDLVQAHYYMNAHTIEPTDGFVSAARAILATNILCADFLEEAATTEVIDYQPFRDGYFTRVWSILDDSAAATMQLDLFHQAPEPKRDEVPVHYFDLAATPEPTRVASSTVKVRRSP